MYQKRFENQGIPRAEDYLGSVFCHPLCPGKCWVSQARPNLQEKPSAVSLECGLAFLDEGLEPLREIRLGRALREGLGFALELILQTV